MNTASTIVHLQVVCDGHVACKHYSVTEVMLCTDQMMRRPKAYIQESLIARVHVEVSLLGIARVAGRDVVILYAWTG